MTTCLNLDTSEDTNKHSKWKKSNCYKISPSFHDQPLTISQMASPPLFSSSSAATISFRPRFPARRHRPTVSCAGAEGEKFDRRNLLLGIGGLYGAASSPALAAPIAPPDLAKCSRGTNLNTKQPLDVDCCPPLSDGITDYKLPPVASLRVRPAAHLVTDECIARYEKATALMKALPEDDPRGFMQQANVHCAYCNQTYDQVGDPTQKLQIHNSWLFYPWHRWYLYFYERILGKLIDDLTFALPFWNWDNPAGMPVPAMFAKDTSPLYNPNRDQDHLRPAVLDLLFSPKSSTNPDIIIPSNLTEMYGEMVRNSVKLEDFYGAKYIVGTAPSPGAGTVERGSHTAVHIWTGDPRSPAREDMGNFYSAARDPIFFSHHSNVDRLWSVWRDLRGSGKPRGFSEPDWLDASFLFYDENANLVRVKVRDTLEDAKMGYTYQKVELPWLNKRPKARVRKSKIATTTTTAIASSTGFPVKLDKIVRVLVDRPKTKRSKKEKEGEEELLVIEGIEVDTAKYVRFEVFVNDEDDKPGEVIDRAEYAGAYSQVPHKNSSNGKSKIRLGLTELLEDLDVEDDDKILVSLVPRAGGEDITIGGVKIVYV